MSGTIGEEPVNNDTTDRKEEDQQTPEELVGNWSR